MCCSQAASGRDVFVIAMENHNLRSLPRNQPGANLGNPAAPYMNSLVTPGNPNAAQVSYAANYFNSGTGVHPSEPESRSGTKPGSDFGFHSNSDPGAAPPTATTLYDNSHSLISQLTANGSTPSFKHFNYTAVLNCPTD